MGSNYVEQLIIYGDHGLGLLNRVHHAISFTFDTKLVPAPTQATLQALSTASYPAANEPTTEPDIVKSAKEIVASLYDYYYTWWDVLQYKKVVLPVLLQLEKDINLIPNFEMAPDFTLAYLNLLGVYVRLHLLAERVKDKELHCHSFAIAVLVHTHKPDPFWHQIAEFFEAMHTPPVEKGGAFGTAHDVIRADLRPLTAKLGPVLQSLSPLIRTYTAASIQKSRWFALLSNQKALVMPKDDKKFTDMQHLQDVKELVIWAVVGCVELLLVAPLGDTIRQVVSEAWVHCIHRDQTIQAQPIFRNYLKAAKAKKEQLVLVGASVKDEDMANFPMPHLEARAYYRAELDTMCKLFSAYPHLIAPKMQVILAMMELSKQEVLWYMRHIGVMPPFKAPFKGFQPIEMTAPDRYRLSDLIAGLQQLTGLLETHAPAVKEYYALHLHGWDRDAVSRAAAQYIQPNLPSEMRALLQAIQDDLAQDALRSFEAMRLNYARVQALIAASPALKMPKPLSDALSLACFRSRIVDQFPLLLRDHGSLHLLIFYPDILRKMQSDSVQVPASLNLPPDVPPPNTCHLLCYLKTLQSAQLNVHRCCPEEQRTLGKISFDLTIELLTSMVTAITKNIFNCVLVPRMALRRKLDNSQILQQLTSDADDLPGAESRIQSYVYGGENSAAANNAMSESMKTLRAGTLLASELCAGMSAQIELVIYNVKFFPKEYLHNHLVTSVRSLLRNTCFAKRADPPAVRAASGLSPADTAGILNAPMEILKALRDVMYTCQEVERQAGLDMSDIFREAMLTEATPISAPALGQPRDVAAVPPAAVGQDNILANLISQWYVDTFFETDPVSRGISYNAVTRCFVSRPALDKRGKEAILIDAEAFTDPPALQALCALMGAGGIRTLDSLVLRHVSKLTSQLHGVLASLDAPLRKLASQYQRVAAWTEMASQLDVAAVDQFATLLARIGFALQFRSLLSQALAAQLHRSSPLLVGAIEAARTLFSGEGKPQSVTLDLLAKNSGMVLPPEADVDLVAALRAIESASSPAWKLFPESVGLLMLSSVWKPSDPYQVESEGHNSNVHCAVASICAILVAFAGQPETNARIQQSFDRTLRCLSSALINLKLASTSHAPKEQNITATNLRSMRLFLEQFCTASHGRIPLTKLEECYPYSILRNSAIKVYESQGAAAVAHAHLDDVKEDEPAAAD